MTATYPGVLLPDGAVTTSKLASGAVTAAKITADASFDAIANHLFPGGIVVFPGHSYTTGTGASEPNEGYAAKLAQMLRMQEYNQGVSGATLVHHATVGSWLTLYQSDPRPASGDISTAVGALAALFFGINDLNQIGNTTANMDPFKQALRSVVAYFMCTRIVEDSDASFVYSGSWSSSSSTSENSGASFHFTPTNGQTATVTTPTDTPAGSIAVIGVTARDNGQGGTHTFTLDGVAAGSMNAFGGATGKGYFPYVFTIPIPSGGAHTIVDTVSAINTLTSVDFLGIIPPTNRTMVLIAKQPKLPDYSAYGSTPPGPPTDTGVTNLNAIIDAVATEFGAISVDLSTMDHDTTMFASDKLHPSDKGHEFIASKMRTAIVANLSKLSTPTTKLFPSYAKVTTSVASAAALVLPRVGGVFKITGTTTITSIPCTYADEQRQMTLIFASTAAMTNGSNLKLKGNLAPIAGDTILLECDGTNWIELTRAAATSQSPVWSFPSMGVYDIPLLANGLWYVSISVPERAVLTGLQVMNGGTITGNLLVGFFDALGNRVALSASAARAGSVGQPQLCPFTAPYTAQPGEYLAGVMPSNGSSTFYSAAALTRASAAALGSFAIPGSITPPSATNRATVPVMATY